ncbi:MAG: Ppx/GppA phosphatase family protein [Cyanobacteria bacterium P01_D01_bin.73]
MPQAVNHPGWGKAPAALATLAENPVLAAIDIGTNSIHMAVVRIDPKLPSFEIIAREKATVRLGDRNPVTGELTPESIGRSLAALSRCRDLAASLQVEHTVAVATSATREAPNGREFIRQVRKELGLRIDLIAGPEEARRIYLGVLSGLEFEGRPHAVIDIGGGSTELILGDGREARYLSSTKVGAVRLTAAFVKHDPPTEGEFIALQGYARGMLERAVEELHEQLHTHETIKDVTLVGTSGTIECLAEFHARSTLGMVPSPLQGYTLTLDAVRDTVEKLRSLTVQERRELPGMNERRAEIIVAGAVILQEAMELLSLDRLVVCERALREGIVVDWMLSHRLIEDRLRFQSSIRERSTLALANKYQVNLAAAEHVAKLSMMLFDQTQGLLHDWEEEERELLWTAAILHGCGLHVGHSAHHKHAYYLIRYGELFGFTETEVEVIANLARYHRKSAPKKRHDSYQNLAGKSRRKLVDELSPLLRLAVALNRRQSQAIRMIQCQVLGDRDKFRLLISPANPDDSCALEQWSIDLEKKVFEEQFEMPLELVVE